jgi:hypothetical protein
MRAAEPARVGGFLRDRNVDFGAPNGAERVAEAVALDAGVGALVRMKRSPIGGGVLKRIHLTIASIDDA